MIAIAVAQRKNASSPKSRRTCNKSFRARILPKRCASDSLPKQDSRANPSIALAVRVDNRAKGMSGLQKYLVPLGEA